MFSRIFLTLFALLFATFMVVSNPLSAVADQHEDAAAEEPAGEDAAGDQEEEADETLKPDEAAGDEAPKY